MSYPNFINNFNMYDCKKTDETKLIGITDTVQLPDINTVTASVSGAGIPGTMEVPVVGQFESMKVDIPFHTFSKSIMNFVVGGTAKLVLRGALQLTNRSTGEIEAQKVVVRMYGTVNKFSPGQVKKADVTNSTVGLELNYFRLIIDDKDIVQINRLTGEYKINGKDAYSNFSKYM